MARTTPVVGVIMGSQSDWQTMRAAAELLEALGIPHEARIVSAHRTPRDRKSTRLNSSHVSESRMPSSA